MPDNDLNTRDDKWKDLLNLEDGKVRILTDGDAGIPILDDWIDKDEDSIDYMRFKLEGPAKVSFTVNADKTAKYTIYRYVNGELEKIESDSLSKAKKKKVKDEDGDYYWVYPENDYSATTKALLLDAGDYFISVQAKDKTVDSRYNVYLNDESVFFGGMGDPDDNKWELIHKNGDPENEYDLGVISASPYGALAEGWVGYGDKYSWRKFTLENYARLRFLISSSDSTMFTLWRLNPDSDTLPLEKVFSTKPKEKDGGDYDLYVRTESKLLAGGTYFFSVDSTNDAKGGSADYSVYLDSGCIFFGPQCNNHDDTIEDVLNDETYWLTSENLGIHDWVGCGDEYDYRVFSLDKAARLYFTVCADDLVKLTIFELATDKRGKEYQKKILSISPESHSSKFEDWKYGTSASGKLFESGKKYYICVKSRNAMKGSGGSAEYSVGIDESKSVFFGAEGGKEDDWDDYDTVGAASKTLGAAGPLQDNKVLSGWVGYGDPKDYYKFSLTGTAKLKFQVNANDSVKFTIYKLVGTAGNYSLKKVQSVTTSKCGKYYDSYENEWCDPEWNYSKKTSKIQLSKGEYYFCVQSTNAAKGGDAYYEVTLDGSSKFYDNARPVYGRGYGPEQKAPDDGSNNIVYTVNENGYSEWNTAVTENPVHVDASTEEIVVDKDVSFEYGDTVYHNFVGQGDECDYVKIVLQVRTKLSLTIDSTDAALFSIGTLATRFEGNAKTGEGITYYYVSSFYSSELLLDQENGGFHLTMPGIMLDAGEAYIISMESLNPDAGGSAYYNITLNQDDCTFTPSKADHSNDWDDLATNGMDSSLICDLGLLNGTRNNVMEGWVGYDDPVDYYKFTIDKHVAMVFTIQCSSASISFSIYQVKQQDSGEYALSEATTTSGGSYCNPVIRYTQEKKGGPFVGKETMSYTIRPGDYCFCISGNGNGIDYSVSITHFYGTTYDRAILDMPELTGSSAMTDDLSFGLYDADADALAAASASSLADLDDISTWQSLTTLA